LVIDRPRAQVLDGLGRTRRIEVGEIDQASHPRCQGRFSHGPTVLAPDATKPATTAGFRNENW
jgi:hypothetical protein